MEESPVRLLVQEEGRAARNVIAFNVPCDVAPLDSSKFTRKPPSSPRTVQEIRKDNGRNSKRTSDLGSVDTRLRSASTGRDKKSELHARYWAFLFGNLQRAVDEIYQTCETDESVAECKEVILVLENFTRDFHSLIEWFRLKWEYEKTPPPQRPTSLAWEVRKSSPGKVHHIAPVFDGGTPCKRHLSFDDGRPDKPAISNKQADKPFDPPAEKPTEKPADKPGEQPADMRPDQTPDLSADKPVDKSAENPADKPPEIPVNKLADKPADKPADNTAVIPANKPPEKPAEKPAEKPVDTERSVVIQGQSLPDSTSQDVTQVVPTLAPTVVPTETPSGNIPTQQETEKEADEPIDRLEVEDAVQNLEKTDQCCQTDLDSDEAADSAAATKCADKAVGTTGAFLPLKSAPAASPLKAAIPWNATTRTSTLRSGVVRSTTNAALPTSKTTPTTTGPRVGPGTLKLSVVSASPKAPVAVGTATPVSPTTLKAAAPVGSTTPAPATGASTTKMSMASVVTKSLPSAASVVKKAPVKPALNPAPRVALAQSTGASTLTHRAQHSSNVDLSRAPVPMLVRSRTIAEVLRPGGSGAGRGVPNLAHTATSRPKTVTKQPLSSVASKNDRNKVHQPAASERTRNNQSAHQDNKSGANTCDDDSHGWETVKGRSRWRLSSSSSYIKQRFNQPSCAVSLPALIVTDDPGDEALGFPTGSATHWTYSARRNSEKNSPQSAKSRRKSHEEKISDSAKPASGKGKTEKSFEIKKTVKVVKSKVLAKNEKNGALKSSSKDSDSLIISNDSETNLNGCKENVAPSESETVRKDAEEKRKKVSPRKSASTPQKHHDDSAKLLDSNKTASSDFFKKKETKSDDEGLGIDDLIEERKLFNEEELKSKQLYEEEAKLQQEIIDLQAADLEQVETDGETNTGNEEEEDELLIDEIHDDDNDGDVDDIPLEDRYENMLEGLSWAERMDTLEQLEALVGRHPGRAQQLHQKLSCPSRARMSLPETLRRFQARQDKAQEKRERLLHLKSQRLRDLLNKVGEVKAAQAQLTEDRRLRLEAKLKRAEENRNLHLRSIKRKAHDEEEKLREIAFINELEAQNKRHDFLALCQEQEERLQGIHEERQRRQEEKAAKEAAVEERRKALEAERQERLEMMQERRRRREERIGREQQEKEKERQELAREKARDREERLSALHAAQLATQEELQKKIQQKQQDSARRHEENMEHIRQRALESGALRCADDVAPNLAPYHSKKLCTVCDVLIGSEVYLLSHMRGKTHQENVKKHAGDRGTAMTKDDVEAYSLRHIIDAPQDSVDPRLALHKERQRGLKKRCKKIRVRMASRGEEHESKRDAFPRVDSPNSSRLQKCLRDVDKLFTNQGTGQWPSNAITLLERCMGEMNRILSKNNSSDMQAFLSLNGFAILSNILSLGLDLPPNVAAYLPDKCFVTACSVYSAACQDQPSNAQYVVFSNRVALILDLLLYRLKNLMPEEVCGTWTPDVLPVDNVACALMKLLTTIMTYSDGDSSSVASSAPASVVNGGGDAESVSTTLNYNDEVAVRTRDVVSYGVATGIVDRLALYCSAVRDPPPSDDHPVCHFLLAVLNLLSALTERCGGVGNKDPTGLGTTLRATELVGAPSMLYGLLLQRGGATRNAPPADAAPPTPTPSLQRLQADLAAATFTLLHRVAELDLMLFQSVLGAEGISLQFRHIASHLLWVCAGCTPSDQIRATERDLLHSVIVVLGYFSVRHHENQMIIQSGHQPTVLQQLCNLPFPYFSQAPLTAILFPTLLACCEGNAETKAILEKELSYQLLDEFRSSPVGRESRLLRLLDPPLKTSKTKTAAKTSETAKGKAKSTTAAPPAAPPAAAADTKAPVSAAKQGSANKTPS